MVNSLNGWPVLDPGSGLLKTGTIPGTTRKLTMRREALPLFLALAFDYHMWVSAIDEGRVDEGAYCYRRSRLNNRWSNHSSGTAIDLNWSVEGALNSSMGRVFFAKPANQKAIRLIKLLYGDVIDWGGDWRTAKDYMHWEIKPGTTTADVEKLRRHLGITVHGVRTRNAMGEPIPARNGK